MLSAADSGNISEMEDLLSSGMNVNASDRLNNTALMAAVKSKK